MNLKKIANKIIKSIKNMTDEEFIKELESEGCIYISKNRSETGKFMTDMRNIKFRIWDKENKKMHMVGALDWDFSCENIVTCNTPENKLYFGYYKDFDPIIMQYIGVCDKNKKDIRGGI